MKGIKLTNRVYDYEEKYKRVFYVEFDPYTRSTVSVDRDGDIIITDENVAKKIEEELKQYIKKTKYNEKNTIIISNNKHRFSIEEEDDGDVLFVYEKIYIYGKIQKEIYVERDREINSFNAIQVGWYKTINDFKR